jgi:glycosyl transferase, family 25
MQMLLVNLDRSPDRLEQFLRVNRHLGDVKRFPAIDGRTIDRDQLVAANVLMPDLDYTPGAVGCALSHIALWKLAVIERQPITVAEDDAVFSHRFIPCAEALLAGADPEWDIIMWGFCYGTFLWVELPQSISVAEIKCRDDLLQEHRDQFQTAEYSSVLLKLRQQYGLFAYSVSPKGATALLQQCLPLSPKLIPFPDFPIVDANVGIDCAMNAVYPNIKAYVCFPPLAVQDTQGTSTIR